MLRLIIFRHSKTAVYAEGGDRERALTKRGRGDAPLMGAYLNSHGIIPDYTLVSDARRARETFDLAAPAFGAPLAHAYEPRIYDAEADDLLALVQALARPAKCLMLIGHNPGFADLALALTGSGDRYASARMRVKFPTSAVAVLDFAGERWADIAPGAGRLDRFITPELLGGEDD